MAEVNLSGEKLLKIEAEEAIKEVSFAVDFVELSSKLPSDNELVFMNLRTKEDEVFCVELSVSGFKIVGKKFDFIDNSMNNSTYFETIYQLLDSVSPGYRNSFGNALMDKLNQLKESGGDE